MDILPAIDLRGSSVVRLIQGDYDREVVYSDDPAAVARTFEGAGARWIHIVDLDAARTGRPANTAGVRAVIEAVSASVELGGGARDAATIEAMLGDGVARVVVGSAALENWEWFEGLLSREDLAGRIALGLDARDGRLAVHGWRKQLDVTAVEIAGRVRGWPLGAIVYTDIARDGMLAGVNVRATASVIGATDVPVVASGGLADLDDVRACKEIGCAGAIVGKAWYDGRIDLARACELAG